MNIGRRETEKGGRKRTTRKREEKSGRYQEATKKEEEEEKEKCDITSLYRVSEAGTRVCSDSSIRF